MKIARKFKLLYYPYLCSFHDWIL